MRQKVTRYPGLHPNSEMTAIGYVIGLGVAVVLLPLLPFILLYLLVTWVLGGR